jgi:tryptophan synthase alpha chain
LPVAVGFGVKDAASAAAIATTAEGVVVGSALVDTVRRSLIDGVASPGTTPAVIGLVKDLARACKTGKSALPSS